MIPHLSDDRLIENTKSLFTEERRLDLEVLRHLYEIERRRLFLERGFPSLFEMCIQEFKLSPASAQRRISAMRLLKEIPEVAPKIQTGELSVSVLAQTQSFLRAEKKQDRPYSKQDKLELITSFENKSIRDVEKELAAKNPAVKQYEVMKPVSATQNRLTLILDNETKAMLDQIRDLISHANPEMTYEGVIARAAKLLLEKELKKIQPLERASKKSSKISASVPSSAPTQIPAPEVNSVADVQNVEPGTNTETESQFPLERHLVSDPKRQSSPQSSCEIEPTSNPKPRTDPRGQRRPSARLKRQIWQRDQACCTYTDPNTGKRCTATAFLQHDHVHPWALGGKTSQNNLRLFCGPHNRVREAARTNESAKRGRGFAPW